MNTRVNSKKLVIVGNGEIAAMAAEYFTHDSTFEVAGFAIGRDYVKESEFCGLPVSPLEEITRLYPPERFVAFVAIGDGQLNRIRRRHFDLVKSMGYVLASYVSSEAFVWKNVEIGSNCFILEHNVLQPFVRIGDNVTLWSGNHIGHRSVIHDDVFISSHVVVSGFCSVGARTFIGVNSAVANGVAIAEDNFIAMCSGITSNTEADRVYQGIPAEARKISATRYCRVEAT